MIKKLELYIQINNGLSISKLATHFNCSSGTIKHYLKKYNFKTCINKVHGIKLKCVICDNDLSGNQRKYCSNSCKSKDTVHHKNNYYKKCNTAINRKLHFIKLFGNKCNNCGYNLNLAALEFHHIDESTKDIKLDMRSFGNHSLLILELEMQKCILLCANCHRERHYPHLNMNNFFSD